MTISSIASSLSGYLGTSQSPYQPLKTAYNQFQQTLNAGNLPGAQQVYTALAKAIQSSPIGQSGGDGYAAVQQSLGAVAQALQSGVVGDVQSALASLGQIINTAAQNVGATPQSASGAMTPAQLTASLVNEIAGGGNASGTTDPLLAALSGSGNSGVTDPLLAALGGGNDNGSTETDPLLAAPRSGVNIVV